MLINLPKATQLSGGGGPGMQLPLGFLSHEWAHTCTHSEQKSRNKKDAKASPNKRVPPKGKKRQSPLEMSALVEK